MDISERRRPQDGRITVKAGTRVVDMRVSSLPTINGEKTGLSFAQVLRATLRQDPDVILVGEMRDFEIADTAFKAALTGHMVLTTLHTNQFGDLHHPVD